MSNRIFSHQTPFYLLFVIFFMLGIAHVPPLFSQQKGKTEKSTAKILEPAMFRILYSYSQQALKEREKIVLTDTMALIVGQNRSIYYDWNKKRRDSINDTRNKKLIPTIKSINVVKDESALENRLRANQQPYNISDGCKGESSRLFKDRSKHEICILDEGPSNMMSLKRTYLLVTESLPPQEWKIGNDTITVLGYGCRKATTQFRGRNYAAWFTLDIPVGDGPWKFYGLPGMILKVEDEDGLFCYRAIGIENTSTETLQMPTDIEIESTTIAQWKKYRKRILKTTTQMYVDGGNVVMATKRNLTQLYDREVEE